MLPLLLPTHLSLLPCTRHRLAHAAIGSAAEAADIWTTVAKMVGGNATESREKVAILQTALGECGPEGCAAAAAVWL